MNFLNDHPIRLRVLTGTTPSIPQYLTSRAANLRRVCVPQKSTAPHMRGFFFDFSNLRVLEFIWIYVQPMAPRAEVQIPLLHFFSPQVNTESWIWHILTNHGFLWNAEDMPKTHFFCRLVKYLGGENTHHEFSFKSRNVKKDETVRDTTSKLFAPSKGVTSFSLRCHICASLSRTMATGVLQWPAASRLEAKVWA